MLPEAVILLLSISSTHFILPIYCGLNIDIPIILKLKHLVSNGQLPGCPFEKRFTSKVEKDRIKLFL